ncbi:hypothetical protein BWI15_08515 [Kribbella sp. ALI-6-A]|nr:hypothetical protein BWI15_08515 [Kribbella sp. ALI-6-A]
MQVRQPTMPKTPGRDRRYYGTVDLGEDAYDAFLKSTPATGASGPTQRAVRSHQCPLPVGELLHDVRVGTLHAEDRQATDDGCSVA